LIIAITNFIKHAKRQQATKGRSINPHIASINGSTIQILT
jgi:hypothetical protein